MHSRTPAEFGAWIRWYHLPLFPALVAQALFVHFYLESSTKWLMWSVIATRGFIFAVNFLVQPNYHFSSIESVALLSSSAASRLPSSTPKPTFRPDGAVSGTPTASSPLR